MAAKKANVLDVVDFKASLLLNQGVDIHTRTYSICEPITFKLYKNMMRCFDLLRSMGSEPVTLRISSPGGDVYAMLSIMDYLLTYIKGGISIYTMAYGEVASAAVPIYSCGERRYSGHFTQFMVHPISYEMGYGKVDDHISEMNQVKSIDRQVAQMMAQKTGTPYNFWLTAGKKSDMWFDCDKALELGLVHEKI